jgi:hypothetical protein
LRAKRELKELACRTEVFLAPLLFDSFFEDLLSALKDRINGDLVVPTMPSRYVAADKEGTVAVVSLLYAALCARRGNVTLRVEESKEHVCLLMEMGEINGNLLFEKEDGSFLALLRSVAKNSGISLSVTDTRPVCLCLRFERYLSVVQVAHTETYSDRFASERVPRYLSLLGRASF